MYGWSRARARRATGRRGPFRINDHSTQGRYSSRRRFRSNGKIGTKDPPPKVIPSSGRTNSESPRDIFMPAAHSRIKPDWSSFVSHLPAPKRRWYLRLLNLGLPKTTLAVKVRISSWRHVPLKTASSAKPGLPEALLNGCQPAASPRKGSFFSDACRGIHKPVCKLR